jgi:hypothetical protein
MSAIIIDLKSRATLFAAKAQGAAMPAVSDAQDKHHAVLKEVNGVFVSADVIAALPARLGHVTLRYPAGTLIEDLPYTIPKTGFFQSDDGFGATFRRLAGKPSICLGDHFEMAQIKPEDSFVPAGLYGLRVAGFHEVTEAGLYTNKMQDIETHVTVGKGIVEFENGEFIIDTLENCRKQIRSVYRRNSDAALTL